MLRRYGSCVCVCVCVYVCIRWNFPDWCLFFVTSVYWSKISKDSRSSICQEAWNWAPHVWAQTFWISTTSFLHCSSASWVRTPSLRHNWVSFCFDLTSWFVQYRCPSLSHPALCGTWILTLVPFLTPIVTPHICTFHFNIIIPSMCRSSLRSRSLEESIEENFYI
jgi:hypothetical protein